MIKARSFWEKRRVVMKWPLQKGCLNSPDGLSKSRDVWKALHRAMQSNTVSKILTVHSSQVPQLLSEIGVLVRIRRRAAAEKAEPRGGRDLVPGAGRNQNRVARCDRTCFSVDLHRALAFEKEIKFLTFLVVVPIG